MSGHAMKRSLLGRAILMAVLWWWATGSCGIAGEQKVEGDVPEAAPAAKGRVAIVEVHGKALEKNLLRLSPERQVFVYLPPSYDTSTEKRYPVVYFLHGNHKCHGLPYGLKQAADSAISRGLAKEMIILTPAAHTVSSKNSGSHYVNSQVTGNWEDFITEDLIAHIDGAFRTLPHRNSRGIAGYSMGGRGSLSLAMKFPDLYAAVFGMSSGIMWLEHSKGRYGINAANEGWTPLLEWASGSESGKGRVPPGECSRLLCFARAYSPNPDRPPLLVDLPYELREGELKRVDAVWKRWLSFDPVVLARSHGENLRRLRAIRFDCGKEDSCFAGNMALSQVLTEMEIPHAFDEFDGGHMAEAQRRIETKVLPFFSKFLDFAPPKALGESMPFGRNRKPK